MYLHYYLFYCVACDLRLSLSQLHCSYVQMTIEALYLEYRTTFVLHIITFHLA